MIKKILFLILIFNIQLYSQKIDENELNKYTNNFLTALQNKDQNSIKKFLISSIKLNLLNKNEFIKFADDLMTEKITTSQYIINITGHNICLFIKSNYDLINFSPINESGIEEIKNDNLIKNCLYYIKYKINYKVNSKLSEDKIIEVDLIKIDNQYKIIGFII